MRLNEEMKKLISEAEYGSRNILLSTKPISLLSSKLFGLSIQAGKIIKKRIICCKNFYRGTCPLNFYCIFLQVFDALPNLNVSHITETNGSWRSEVWYEGPCPTSLSVAQNNCWLVVESNLEKKIQSSTQKYRTPSKLQNEIIKNYCCFKV